MIRTRILVSETVNPWFNLATEEWIFREMDPNVQTLFLWRNQNTVVIGRNQNPWSECNLTRMEEDGIILARRTSGGGAVYHDLGNTNFTFLSPREGYSRATNNEIVLLALKNLGVVATASGRNDLTIETDEGVTKVSGSAFRETRDRAFHHGTLLVNANLTQLANYLTPHPKKLESKGKASVRSRVSNLCEVIPDLTHEKLCVALIEAFNEVHGVPVDLRTSPEILNPLMLQADSSLNKTFHEFSTWDWRYGHAPKFHQKMVEYLSFGFMELHLDAEKGRIENAKLFSDSLYLDLIASIEHSLIMKPFTKEGIEQMMIEVLAQHPDRVSELDELRRWLQREVEI